MSQREKTLAMLVGAVLLLWGGTQGLSRYRAAVERSENRLSAAEQDLADAKFELAKAERAKRQLGRWRAMSLPTDPDVARSLYQDWLQEQLTSAGVEVDEVTDTSPNVSREHFRELTFKVVGKASLAAWTNFFAAMQHAGQLHRVSFVSLTPVKDSPNLRATVNVDALVLPGCRREDRLADAPEQTGDDPLADDREAITSRNIFTAHSETPKDSGNKSDDAAKAVVSAMTYGRGGWTMTVRREDKDELLQFREGDRLRVGEFRGRVLEVDGRKARVQTREGVRVLSLGKRLSEAVAEEEPS